MTPPISASTRLFAVLGDPVAHSISPRIQNAAIDAYHLDAVYVAMRTDAESLPGLLRGIARSGGGGNVTLPHKQRAAALVDGPTPAVTATGACNTFWFEDGVIRGDNTDVEGFTAAACTLLQGSPAGARVLLLGAGGAARASLFALTQAGADQVVILNRTVARAEAIIASASVAASRVSAASAPGELRGQSFDLIVNATSLGLRDQDPLPLDPDAGLAFSAALDLVYAPAGTAWIRDLHTRGIPAADGKEMLIQQGAASFKRWWKKDAPIDEMREAISSAR